MLWDLNHHFARRAVRRVTLIPLVNNPALPARKGYRTPAHRAPRINIIEIVPVRAGIFSAKPIIKMQPGRIPDPLAYRDGVTVVNPDTVFRDGNKITSSTFFVFFPGKARLTVGFIKNFYAIFRIFQNCTVRPDYLQCKPISSTYFQPGHIFHFFLFFPFFILFCPIRTLPDIPSAATVNNFLPLT